ncbi:MAG: WXG100 family type VII secretion target [Bacillota bacterium]|nr:WXG100 family type VII secretion target [Bacillota bacterium]
MRIQVNYEEVLLASNVLVQKGNQYEEIVNRIYARMHEMQAVWQGSDNQAFISQLESFQPKLKEVKSVIDSYANFLSASAKQYQALQQERIQQARRLA